MLLSVVIFSTFYFLCKVHLYHCKAHHFEPAYTLSGKGVKLSLAASELFKTVQKEHVRVFVPPSAIT